MEESPVGVEAGSQAEKEQIDRDKLFEFYLAVRSEQIEWMNRHGQNLRQYVVLITAILAATLGAVYQFRDNAGLALATSLGFVANIALCGLAVWACDRSYQRFLEAVTIAAKLEAFFRLDGPRPGTTERANNSTRFPKDTRLLPERWLTSRHEETSAEFVRHKMNRGGNLVVRITMGILATMNAFLWWVTLVFVVCHACRLS